MHGRDFADANRHLVLAKPRVLAAGYLFFRLFVLSWEKEIAPRPPAGTKDFRRHMLYAFASVARRPTKSSLRVASWWRKPPFQRPAGWLNAGIGVRRRCQFAPAPSSALL